MNQQPGDGHLLTEEEQQLLNAYQLLNDAGKARFIEYLSDVVALKRYTEQEDDTENNIFFTGGREH